MNKSCLPKRAMLLPWYTQALPAEAAGNTVPSSAPGASTSTGTGTANGERSRVELAQTAGARGKRQAGSVANKVDGRASKRQHVERATKASASFCGKRLYEGADQVAHCMPKRQRMDEAIEAPLAHREVVPQQAPLFAQMRLLAQPLAKMFWQAQPSAEPLPMAQSSPTAVLASGQSSPCFSEQTAVVGSPDDGCPSGSEPSPASPADGGTEPGFFMGLLCGEDSEVSAVDQVPPAEGSGIVPDLEVQLMLFEWDSQELDIPLDKKWLFEGDEALQSMEGHMPQETAEDTWLSEVNAEEPDDNCLQWIGA